MNKEILRLAIPNILSNISIPLLSSFDTALMGRLTELHIGAVGVGAMIFNFVYWNFGFLRMGTTGMTAQAYGRRNESEMVDLFGRAMLVALGLSILVLVLQQPLGELTILLLQVPDAQAPLVETYFYIRVWAAPATLSSFAIMGWFFGMQNAIFPLILTIVVNVVNMAVSYVLVMQYGMETAGVAYGTLIAQYVGLVLGFGLFFGRYRYLLPHFRKEAILKWEALSRFLTVNRDIFIRTICLTLAFAFFYRQSGIEGEMILAVNVILLQFLNWMSYGVDGFAFASESLVGKYAGSGDHSKTKQAIRLSFTWGMALAALYGLGYWLFGPELVRIFTNQNDVIQATLPYLFWMAIFPVLSTPCYIWDGIFIGLTAGHSMRNTMLLAFGVYLLAYFGLKPFGNDGLWLTLLLFMIARGGFQHLWYWRKGLALS